MNPSRAKFDQQILPVFNETRADYLVAARAWAERLGRNGRLVTINDVRRKCPPPAHMDPRVMGAVFVRSLWEVVGYSSTSRREAHGRPIALFRLRGFAE